MKQGEGGRNGRPVWIAVLWLGTVLGLLAGCRDRHGAVTLAGASAFEPLAERLAESFMAANPGSKVVYQVSGSAAGMQAALAGAVDIGVVDMVALPPEAQSLRAIRVARDAIAVIVHPSNRVENLTLAQVRDIFGGRILNWREVGGPDHPINVVSRERGSGTRSSFEQLLGGLATPANLVIDETSGAVRATVMDDPNAIGYVSFGSAQGARAVPIEGVPCEREQVLAGRYPLVCSIGFLVREPVPDPVQSFIRFVLSPDGQTMVGESRLIPVP